MRSTHAFSIAGLSILIIILGAGLSLVLASDPPAENTASKLPTPGLAGGFTQPTVIFDESAIQSVPVLTSEQEQQVTDIALSDTRVRQLMAGHSYEVTGIVPWTGTGLRLIGAVVTLSFDNPTLVTGSWLAFSWSCDRDPIPPPISVSYDATYDEVTSVQVFANLETGMVDQILPFGDGSETLVGNREFTGDVKAITSCYDD